MKKDLNERHKKIAFLGKLARQMIDKTVPYSYKYFVYVFITCPNPHFDSICNIIGIDAEVWRTKYRQLFQIYL